MVEEFEAVAPAADGIGMDVGQVVVAETETIRDAPTEPDPLAQKWKKRIDNARKHWKPFFERCEHNRRIVSGFDWSVKPDEADFYGYRANLILSAIASVLPNLYARNPEMSVEPTRRADAETGRLEKFTETLGTVLNTYLERALLKVRGRAAVRSALTCSYGIVKVVYQRDIEEDPIIRGRIQDAQDNLQKLDGLIARLADTDESCEQVKAQRAELQQTVQGLLADAEAKRMDGLVIDRIMTDQLLIDPSVVEFEDYSQADWMAQIVPMSRRRAEEIYKVKLGGARKFKSSLEGPRDGEQGTSTPGGLGSGAKTESDSEDDQVCILEIWDRMTQRVYTMAEGCSYFLREPYSPEKVGGRWYPFFLLTYQTVDGKFVAPSMVDLMEKLQDEHNETRETFVEHRRLCKPGYVAAADVDQRSLERFTDAVLGEVVVLKNADGQDPQQLIRPKATPPIDPAVYDTSVIRQDIEQVTGLQDAMRSTVVQPKTATEAQIMQQGLSGRVSAFRDSVEDWLQEIATYAAQILLRELTEADVARIMGDPVPQVDPATGQAMGVIKPYDWPQLTTEQVSRLIKIRITAGSTGAPDKAQLQESWQKVLPTIQGLEQFLYQIKAQGLDATPLETLLKETVRRFDDRIDAEKLIPQINAQQIAMQQAAAAAPQQGAGGDAAALAQVAQQIA